MENRKDILNELIELKSSLAERPALSCFKVPEGYFNMNQSVLSDLLFEQDELQAGEEAFSVPENYFAEQRAAVLAEIEKEDARSKTIIRPLRKYGRWAASIAAILCLFAIGSYLSQNDTSDAILLSSITDTEILNYLSDDTEVEDMLFASVLDVDDNVWADLDIDESTLSSFLLEDDDILINEYLDYELY